MSSPRTVLLILPLLTSGCLGWASAALPPALSDDERAVVAHAHLPLTVGVERYEHPAYSDKLLDGLRATELFDDVAPLDEFAAPPSLVARVDRQIYGHAMIPFWTFLTFGIVPTSADEESGYSFTLSPPDRPQERVRVEYAHRGRTTLGWVALVDGFLPDRTIAPFSPDSSSRMIDRVKLAILARREDLVRLTSPASR